MPQSSRSYQRFKMLIALLSSVFLTSLGSSALILLYTAPPGSGTTVLGASLLIGLITTLVVGFSFGLPLQRNTTKLNLQIASLSLNRKPSTTRPALGLLDPVGKLLHRKQHQLARRYCSLRGLTERMRRIFEQANDAIFLIDPATHQIIDCNPRVVRLLGYTREQLLASPIDQLVEQSPLLHAFLEDALTQQTQRHQVTQFKAKGGISISLDLSYSMLDSEDNRMILLIGRDLSEHECAQHQIQHLAFHDTLTDLPNRTLLTDRVNRALKRSHRSRQIGALLFIDLDNFKRINDSLGHSVGDLLLQELAFRLRHGLREEDTISRLGGDEFVILIEQLGTVQEKAEQQIHEIADKVRYLMAQQYDLNGHELYVTGSIGYVTFPRDGETMETLLRHADLAMYNAKQTGRDKITRFTDEMDELATKRLRVESEVRNAMRNGEMQLYFQPVLRIRDGFMLGAESLLRWIHPEDGEIAPKRFLPQIEDSALMLQLADWVLQEAFNQQAAIAADRSLLRPDYLAINLSHQQFHQPNFVEQVKRTLEFTGADPKRILFEITETIIMNDSNEARARMLQLKDLGFRFAIDDFGTGYSSLSYLKQLPADTLKIDKGFVQDITTDPDDAAIVKTILGIADHMGMQVIAEGVETFEQLSYLRSNGCAYYQGYLGRPPISQEEFIEELRQSQRLKVVP